MQSADELYKVGFCGESGVGKTSLIELIMHDFRPTDRTYRSTIGVAFRKRNVVLPPSQRAVCIMFWDVTGQESTPTAVSTIFYRGTDALVVVYDVTSRTSFVSVKSWVSRKSASTQFVIVIGNKLDLAATKRAVPVDEAARYCAEHGFSFFETSALDATNVEQMTVALAAGLSKSKPLLLPSQQSDAAQLSVRDGVSIADAQDKRSVCGC